jgi:ABC-type amino acid transport substrate-binding protein
LPFPAGPAILIGKVWFGKAKMPISRCETIIAAALLSVLCMGTPEAGETLDRIKSNGVLKMSTDPEYPPQSSLDPDTSEFVGFDIDVGREIAKRLGVDIQFATPGWDVITAGRWAGRWDMSVGSMTPTRERAEVLDFPRPSTISPRPPWPFTRTIRRSRA